MTPKSSDGFTEKQNAELLRILSWLHKSNRAVTEPKIYRCENGHRSYFPQCETCKALEALPRPLTSKDAR
jgi:hypothetical protein